MNKRVAMSQLNLILDRISEIQGIVSDLDDSNFFPEYHFDLPSLQEFENTVLSGMDILNDNKN